MLQLTCISDPANQCPPTRRWGRRCPLQHRPQQHPRRVRLPPPRMMMMMATATRTRMPSAQERQIQRELRRWLQAALWTRLRWRCTICHCLEQRCPFFFCLPLTRKPISVHRRRAKDPRRTRESHAINVSEGLGRPHRVAQGTELCTHSLCICLLMCFFRQNHERRWTSVVLHNEG